MFVAVIEIFYGKNRNGDNKVKKKRNVQAALIGLDGVGLLYGLMIQKQWIY